MGSVPLVTQDNPSANDFPYSARASDTTKFACFLKRFQHSLNRCLGNRQFCCQLPDGQTRITCYGIYYQRFIVRIVLTIVRIVLTCLLSASMHPRTAARTAAQTAAQGAAQTAAQSAAEGAAEGAAGAVPIELLW